MIARNSALLVGVDFDNTIVCYDALFHRVAVEQGLVPRDLAVTKQAVRDYLRAAGREDAWTEMQGYVYGARMNEAEAFPGAIEFFLGCRGRGIPVCIISHKTRHPYAGQRYDLHAAARGWLESRGFHDPARIGLPEERVWFELTKSEKLARIGMASCTHFVDDLPEFLAEPDFPAGVQRILFDPNGAHAPDARLTTVASWHDITAMVEWLSRGMVPGVIAAGH